MEFKQINTFLEICRRGSFQEASGHLALTQPALSRQISLLEKELGGELFDRSSRKIRLTARGDRFREKAEELKKSWEETLAIFLENETPAGEYLISTGGTIAAWILPPILLEIRKKHPDIKFRVYEGDAKQTRQAVIHGEVDLAILSGPVREKGLETSFFIRDKIVPVANKKHPVFKSERPPRVEDLADEDFVLFHAASDIRRIMEARFLRIRFEPTSVMEVRSLGSVIHSVEAGLGIGFLSSLSLSPRLRILEIPDLMAERNFFFCHRQNPGRGLLQVLEWMSNWARRNLDPVHTALNEFD